MAAVMEKMGGAPPILSSNLHPDGEDAAKAAGLRYVSDLRPGIRRERDGDGFAYVSPRGERIGDETTLARIRSLAIPPAWEDVWICPVANGHIQATGRDARGRKQYRYHGRWRETRDATKYDRMIVFGEALPQIRDRVDHDLGLPGMPREKALATVLRLMERTFIRVGNEEYAKQNRSYGLTTLRNRHVDVSGSTIRFHFRGKSGVKHEVNVRDRRLARIIKQCQELPGQELFEYMAEDGQVHSVNSADVNSYLREISGQDFTAKDFRTWAGTVLAFLALCQCEACDTATQAKKNVVEVVKCVAGQLGNTPAVCRKCYIHPQVLDAYLDAETRAVLRECVEQTAEETSPKLHPEEVAVLLFLRQRRGEALAPEATRHAA